MTSTEARNAAVALLKDEANELACMAHPEPWKELPRRAKVAIQNEIQRLRTAADALIGGESELAEVSSHGKWTIGWSIKLIRTSAPCKAKYLANCHALPSAGPNSVARS